MKRLYYSAGIIEKMMLSFFCIIIVNLGFSQTTYTWNLAGGGSWSTAANWSPTRTVPANNDILIFQGSGNKTITNVPTQTIGRLTITGTTNVTLQGTMGTQTLTIGNGTGDDLIVEAGRTLNIASSLENVALAENATANISGTFVNNSVYNTTAAGTVTTVTGTFRNSGNGSSVNGSTAAKFLISSGGIFDHNRNGGTVPTATWNATSNLQISGVTDSWPTGGMTQTFGNVLFQSDIDAGSNVTMGHNLNCAGNLTISNTGGDDLRLSNTTGDYTITVGGNFSITNGNFLLVSDDGDGTLDVTGNFSQSGGVFTMKEDNGAAAINVTGDFTKTGGTLNMRTDNTSTSKIDVNGNFSMSAGTLNMSSGGGGGGGGIGELNVAGNFAATGGTITETTTSGTVTFDGTGTQLYSSGSTISNSINFTVKNGSSLQMAANTTVVSGGGSFTLESGAFLGVTSAQGITTTGASGNIQVTGTRTYSTGAHYEYNGTVNQVTGNGLTQNIPSSLTIGNTGVVSLSAHTTISGNLLIREGTFSAVNGANNYNFNIGGNWTNLGTSFNPGTGVVVFNGIANQTVGGTTVTSFGNIDFDKTSGIGVMNQDMNVNGTLNIGVNLNIGSHILNLGSSAGTIGTKGAGGFSATKMIISDGGGEIRRNLTSQPAGLLSFPIGDNSGTPEYSPVGLLFTGGTYAGYVSVKVTDAKHPNLFNTNNFLTRYWTINQTGLTGFSATVGVTYTDDDIVGDETYVRMGKWDGADPWTRFDPSITPALNLLNATVTSFSDFTGMSLLEALPVKLSTLSARLVNKSTELKWATSEELNSSHYEVERSSDGRSFAKIGSVTSMNSVTGSSYKFTDNYPASGKNYYRLKMVDIDGKFEYSHVVMVTSNAAVRMDAYPNPTSSKVTVQFSKANAGATMKVVSMEGRVMNQIAVPANTTQMDVNLTGMVPGIYTLIYSNNGEQSIKRIQKL